MNDPIRLKASIQTEYGDKSIRQINRTILLIKVCDLFNNESFIFLITFLFFLGGIHLVSPLSFGSLAESIIFHLLIYHFYYKKALLKDSDVNHREYRFIIECLEELKTNKN